MTERITNNAQSELATAIDAVDDPVTFTVDDASAFPADGDFTILIGSEYLLVTAVAGDDFTADRAQESSVIAAHSIDAVVSHILTARSLGNLIREFQEIGVPETLGQASATPIPLTQYPTGVIPLTAGLWLAQANLYLANPQPGGPGFTNLVAIRNGGLLGSDFLAEAQASAFVGGQNVAVLFEAVDGDTLEFWLNVDGQTFDVFDSSNGSRVGLTKIGP